MPWIRSFMAAVAAPQARLSRRFLLVLMSLGVTVAPPATHAAPSPARRADRLRARQSTPAAKKRRCPSGKRRCGGRCVNLKSSPANCGACGATCAADLTCRDGTCAPKLIRRFGRKGTRPGEFDFPTDVAVAPDGSLYLADTFNRRIQHLTATGQPVSQWGNSGHDPSALLDDPFGVAIAPNLPDGHPGWGVWVADTWHDRVKLFTADGEALLREFGDTQGANPGQFNLSQRIAVDAAGRIFATDLNNARVQSWDFPYDGLPDRTWGTFGTSNGQFRSPTGIAPGLDGNLYVVDKLNFRVQVFTANGTFVRAWGEQGSGNGQFGEPRGIAYGPDQLVYVTDVERHNVQVFAPDGTFRFRFGQRGAKPGQFRDPSGIAVTSAGIFVADSGNHRIQQFAPLPAGI